jgi:hypothetical protein
MIDMVNLWAIVLEIRGARPEWNKDTRTGVVTRRSVE